MAKNTITRAQALDLAITALADNAEAVEVLTKMKSSITKPREKVTSKARLANENLARQVAEYMEPEREYEGKELSEHVNYLTSPQKVAAVMRVASEMGLCETIRDGRKTSYKLV